jgi:hypothetical protein
VVGGRSFVSEPLAIGGPSTRAARTGADTATETPRRAAPTARSTQILLPTELVVRRRADRAPLLWVDRVVVTRAGSAVGKVASFVDVAFQVFV